jgi:hypothetical protein
METREEEIGSGLGCRSVSQCGGDKWRRRTLPPAVGRLVLAVGPVQRRMTALMGHACHATATASYLLLPPSMRCKKEECVNMLLAVIGVCARPVVLSSSYPDETISAYAVQHSYPYETATKR